MDTSRIAGYVLQDKLYRAVPGWLSEGATSALIAFGQWQQENDCLGDVAEIGVHHGKLFILLANLRRQDERAFAVDIFDDQPKMSLGMGTCASGRPPRQLSR